MQLTQDEYNDLYEVVEPARVNLLDYSVGDFIRFIHTPDSITAAAEEQAADDLDAVRIAKGIITAIEGLLSIVKEWQPAPTPEQQHASQGVAWPTFAQSIIVECVEAYHLHSSQEAERLPLADWFIIHKHHSAQRRYEANYNAIITRRNAEAKPR